MKFVHAADLHIDSPLRGLDRYEGAPVSRLRGATRRALENLVATCIEERAAFLLIAGDVFDGGWKDYSTGLFFGAQMARLREAGIAVVLVRGNHDAQSAITKALRLPDNVHELSAKKPETVELDDAGAAVHGQSFAQRAVTDDLTGRYPDRVPGVFNIGLLHTSLDGREGHEPYAPTTTERMIAKGYDYWALGHVHAREEIARDPFIVFPGNIQGRHARETGPKGASIVTVEDGVVAAIEHRALDVVRWEMVSIDAAAATDALEIVDLARIALEGRAREIGERTLAARIRIGGRTRANGAIRRDVDRFVNELRAAATDTLGDGVWIEKILVDTQSALDRARVLEEPSAIGHLARRLETIKANPTELAELAGIFADLERKLPVELREGEGFSLTSADAMRALVGDVEEALLARLMESGES